MKDKMTEYYVFLMNTTYTMKQSRDLAMQVNDSFPNATRVLVESFHGMPRYSALILLESTVSSKVVAWHYGNDHPIKIHQIHVELIHALNVPKDYLERAIESEKVVAEQRLALYRKNKSAPTLKGKTVILVDDGIATGATMIAAVRSSRASGAKEVIIAVPVAPPDTLKRIASFADEVICLYSTDDFMAISQFYAIFPQIEDNEIINLLGAGKK